MANPLPVSLFAPGPPLIPSIPPPQTPPQTPSMDEITPNLFLGNLAAVKSPEFLISNGITHVLSLTSEVVQIPEWAYIVHQQFRVRDNRRQNLLVYLLDGVKFLEEAFTGMLPVLTPLDPSYVRGDVDKDEESHVTPSREVKVFVHCRMGISRSGSVIVAYVMKHHGLPYEAALSLVRSKRSIVRPNHAFAVQLQLLAACGFDLSSLGLELLNQTIENPYDPDELLDRHHTHQHHRSRGLSSTIATPQNSFLPNPPYLPVATISALPQQQQRPAPPLPNNPQPQMVPIQFLTQSDYIQFAGAMIELTLRERQSSSTDSVNLDHIKADDGPESSETSTMKINSDGNGDAKMDRTD